MSDFPPPRRSGKQEYGSNSTGSSSIYEMMRRRQDKKQLEDAYRNISERADRQTELQMQANFKQSHQDINPLNNMFLKHSKALSFVALEMIHNTMFHFIETVKVRGQSRNLTTGDISLYFVNQVEKKPLISGIVSGFFGSGIGALTFMTSYKYFSEIAYSYSDSRYKDADFRYKNMVVYMISDTLASITKLPFECRKQLVQMSNYDIEAKIILRNSYYGMMPLIARDVGFRSIILGTYYATTDIEHRPVLRYSIPQIMDFMKQRREQGYDDSLSDMQSIFYEHHNYIIKTKATTRLTMLIFANLIGTLLTNPFDVVLSKTLTQNQAGGELKYKGLIHGLKTVYKEEGRGKFLGGIHPRFMFNLFNGVMFLFVYDRFTHYIDSIYDN